MAQIIFETTNNSRAILPVYGALPLSHLVLEAADITGAIGPSQGLRTGLLGLHDRDKAKGNDEGEKTRCMR